VSIEQELWSLAAEGDARAVKRRYSQALKITRPEDDPIAFQRLHDAYQRAVARCDAIGASGDLREESLPPAVAAPPVAPVLDSTFSPQPPAADRVALLLQQAATLETMEFARWLRARTSKWSLDARDEISARILSALRSEQAPMRSDNATALFQALGWDDVSCQINPHELQWLAHLANGAWLQLPTQHRALLATLHSHGGDVIAPRELATALDLLRWPRSHSRNLRTAVFGWSGDQLVGLMAVLGCRPGAPLPKGIDPGQAAFWSAAAQPFHRVALQVAVIRAVVAGVSLALVAALAARFTGAIDWAFSGVAAEWRTHVAVLGALLAPALLIVAFWLMPNWQNAREEEPVPLPWLRILALPLLIAAITAGWIQWLEVGLSRSGVPALCAIWLASTWVLWIARSRFHVRRGRTPSRFGIAEKARMVAAALVLPALVAALVYWLLDLLHHGRVLRWRAAPNG